MNINQLFRVYMNEAGADGAAAGGGDGKGGDAGAGGDSKGAAGAGGGDGLLASHAASEADKAAQAAAAAAGKPVRPDDVPEQFWDAEKGVVKNDAVLKSWKDTRAALEAEKKNKGGEKAPAKAEDYKFNLPVGDDGKAVALKVEPNDEAVKLAQNAAHAAGMSQATFDKFMGAFITGAMPLMPAPVDMEAEKKTLGANADAVIGAVHAWGKNLVDTGLWSQDEFQEIVYMGSTAVGIRALNKLRESMGEKPIPLDALTNSSLPSKEELYAKVNDPKYQTDPSFRAEVDKQFKQVFGEQQAGSSEAGLGVRTAVAR